MSKSKLPSARVSSPSRFSRLRWLGTPFRRIGTWFSHQPRTVQIGIVAVLLAGSGAGLYYANSYRLKRGTARDVAAAWGEYYTAASKANIEGIRTALDRVLAIDPADPTATRYKAMLDRGEADADVPELAIVLLHLHLANDRRAEAAREGEKVLAKNPKDWVARCAVAHHALAVRKDRALAEELLNQLPDPEDPAANVGASGLNYALKLSEAVGRDTSTLRKVIVRRLLPHLKREAAATASPAVKLQLLECYLEPFADPGSLAELFDYLAAADKLADSAVSDAIAAGDVKTLIGLASLWRPMRVALLRLKEHDPSRLPDDRLKPLAKAVDDRTRLAWQAVREKAPNRVESYRGLAQLALLDNDPVAARLIILDGLEKCGDRGELLELLLMVTRSRGDENLESTFRSVWDAAVTAKTDPDKWCLVAYTAAAMDRHDAAMEACMHARQLQRDHPRACQTEAELWLRAGEFMKAREALLPLGETALRTRPALAHLYARTLAESLWILVDDEFKSVLEAQTKLKVKTSAPSLAFLLGVLEATPTQERAEWVASSAARVLDQDPSAIAARRIRAAALLQLAELSVTSNPKGGLPLWNGNLVAVALRAFEELSPEERSEPVIAAAIATLQLKGQGNAATALRTAGVLSAVEGSLDYKQLEILGAVLAANDKPADAIRVLERSARLSPPRTGPSTGLWVALAVAYQKNNQPDQARDALNHANATPNRSAREQAEFVFAKQLLLKENP